MISRWGERERNWGESKVESNFLGAKWYLRDMTVFQLVYLGLPMYIDIESERPYGLSCSGWAALNRRAVAKPGGRGG